MADQKQDRSEAKEWLYRLTNDPKRYEKEAFIDGIEQMNHLIKELEKIRKVTHATDHFLHAKIAKERKQLEETLSRLHDRYELYKTYKKKMQ